MGRGRKGPIDQSRKKPKISKNKERGDNWQQTFGIYHYQKNIIHYFLSKDFLDEMKQMSPQN